MTVINVSPRQLRLMAHATGFNGNEPFYRNRFSAAPGSEDDKEWRDLVEKKMAELMHLGAPENPLSLNHYAVTELGKGTLELFKKAITS